MTTRQVAARAAGVGVVLGGAVGALMMRAAWEHNPQGAFHDEAGRVADWAHWLLVGAGWGLVAAAAGGGLAWVVLRALAEPSQR